MPQDHHHCVLDRAPGQQTLSLPSNPQTALEAVSFSLTGTEGRTFKLWKVYAHQSAEKTPTNAPERTRPGISICSLNTHMPLSPQQTWVVRPNEEHMCGSCCFLNSNRTMCLLPIVC